VPQGGSDIFQVTEQTIRIILAIYNVTHMINHAVSGVVLSQSNDHQVFIQ